MTERASVTVSPSSSSTSRSTPCVDGCCGPMLTTMRSSWIGSPSPPSTVSQSPPVTVKTRPSVVSRARRRTGVCRCHWYDPPLVRRRDLRALVLDRDAAERVVLALRVALPVVRHQDPGQGRVAVEDDAEHVVGLPLLPVGGRVDAGDARHVRVLDGHRDLQPDPAPVRHRRQLVDDVQPPLVGAEVVDTGHRRAQLEAQRRRRRASSGTPRRCAPARCAASARPGRRRPSRSRRRSSAYASSSASATSSK